MVKSIKGLLRYIYVYLIKQIISTLHHFYISILIFRHTKKGRLSLFNSLIDIDGNCEIGEKVFRCDSVRLTGWSGLPLQELDNYWSVRV